VRFTDELAVGAAPGAVFATLADLERAAGCLPGAWIDGQDGDAHTGGLRLRLGSITPVYRGSVRVVVADRAARRLVLDARGRDDEGSGPAGARVEVAVVPDEDGASRLRLDADLVVRGRVARGGRGVLAEVSHDLAARFAEELGALADAVPPEPGPPEPAPPEPAPPEPAPPEPAPHVSGIDAYSREHRSRGQFVGAVAGALGIGALVAVGAVAVWRGRAR
jgi:uncharacterized protein